MSSSRTSVWEWAQRADLLWSWIWPFVKPWIIPFVAVMVAAYWSALEHLRPSQVFVAALYAFAGGLFIVAGLWALGKARSSRGQNPVSETLAGPSPPAVLPENRVINDAGFRFYPSREQLAQEVPLRKQLESADEVWALWGAGTHASTQDVLKTGRIKRLLLADPHGPSFETFCAVGGKQPEHVRNDVKRLTAEAQKLNVPVRWWRGHITNSMMIGGPDSVKGWIHVELLFPHTGAGDRPSIRIGRREFSSLFRHFKQAYEQMWNEAGKPPAERR